MPNTTESAESAQKKQQTQTPNPESDKVDLSGNNGTWFGNFWYFSHLLGKIYYATTPGPALMHIAPDVANWLERKRVPYIGKHARSLVEYSIHGIGFVSDPVNYATALIAHAVVNGGTRYILEKVGAENPNQGISNYLLDQTGVTNPELRALVSLSAAIVANEFYKPENLISAAKTVGGKVKQGTIWTTRQVSPQRAQQLEAAATAQTYALNLENTVKTAAAEKVQPLESAVAPVKPEDLGVAEALNILIKTTVAKKIAATGGVAEEKLPIAVVTTAKVVGGSAQQIGQTLIQVPASLQQAVLNAQLSDSSREKVSFFTNRVKQGLQTTYDSYTPKFVRRASATAAGYFNTRWSSRPTFELCRDRLFQTTEGELVGLFVACAAAGTMGFFNGLPEYAQEVVPTLRKQPALTPRLLQPLKMLAALESNGLADGTLPGCQLILKNR